jgi:hypothetical protein
MNCREHYRSAGPRGFAIVQLNCEGTARWRRGGVRDSLKCANAGDIRCICRTPDEHTISTWST